MGDLRKKEISQEDIKKLENTNITVEVTSPEEEHKKAVHYRKKLLAWGLVLLIVIEGAGAVTLGQKIVSDNLQKRVSREYEIRSNEKIQLTKGFYSGETDFGYFSGQGNFTFENGGEYVGEWLDNQLSGYGDLHVPNEGNYQGEFFSSKKSGQGTFTWDDGVVYQGEWKDDKMCGQGTYTTPGGVIFSGTFNENAFQDGTCEFKNDTGNYILTYKSGKIDKASIKYTDGSSYTGTCEPNELTGSGKMQFVNGDVYNGAFSKGNRNGQGVYSWTSGDKYDGEWKEDQMNGSGTYTYSDGSCASGTFNENAFTDGSYYIKNDFGEYTFTITAGETIG